MSESQESAVQSEVTKFLKRRRNDYCSLHQLVNEELRRLKEQPKFHDAIYRIYSRQDKQIGGELLKDDLKIAKNLSELRADNRSTSVGDIDDIIGITVVTYFTSQREVICDALQSPGALRELEIVQRKPKNEKGYHAIHFITKCKTSRLRDLLCEIQVKTLLDDGWATKTHDLTYKPKSGVSINPELKAQIDILGDSIRLIERQSDIVRKLIEHEWSRDKKRRTAAQQTLLLAFIQVQQTHEDADIRKWTAAIIKGLQDHREELKECGQHSKILKQYLDIWENLVKQGRHTLYSCRLITFLASLRDGGELNNSALDAIDKWIGSTADDHRENVRACAFRAFANYTFGYFSEAVHDSEIALQRAEEEKEKEKEKDNDLAAGIKMNLAYFIAEEFYQNPSGHTKETDYARVKTLLSDAESMFTGNPRAFEDTRGAIKIAFGKSEEQIRDGLSLCCAARSQIEQGTPERAAADAFYRLHEHRACHRLLQWE